MVRYRPLVRERWRESDKPGAGLWYELGSHLLEQTIRLFGGPQSLWLDQTRQREQAVTDDWCHAVWRYDRMRVVLHASDLTARLAPRWGARQPITERQPPGTRERGFADHGAD